MLVALLLPCPSALEEKAQRGNYCWLYQQQVLCRFFSLGKQPGVQQEHGGFWLGIKKITEKLTVLWLSWDSEAKGWGGTLERNNLTLFWPVLTTFVSLHPCVPRYWKAVWRNIGWINANLACVPQDVLICQSLVEHWGEMCRTFRGEWMCWHCISKFLDTSERLWVGVAFLALFKTGVAMNTAKINSTSRTET